MKLDKIFNVDYKKENEPENINKSLDDFVDASNTDEDEEGDSLFLETFSGLYFQMHEKEFMMHETYLNLLFQARGWITLNEIFKEFGLNPPEDACVYVYYCTQVDYDYDLCNVSEIHFPITKGGETVDGKACFVVDFSRPNKS